MRNLIAIAPILALGLLLVAACGNSNTAENGCTDTGGVCLKSAATCGDALPYSCPSGGVCCSSTATPASEKVTPESTEPAPH